MFTDQTIRHLIEARRLPDPLAGLDGIRVNTPAGWQARHQEILELLTTEVYGQSPPPPPEVTGNVRESDPAALAGKAELSTIDLSFETPAGPFSFPLQLLIPHTVERPPLVVNIAFRSALPDLYFPAEEIVDLGYAVARFCYQDVAPDVDDNFAEGLAGMYSARDRPANGWGKIAIWAWAAQRVMDYLQGIDRIDRKRIGVIGHSRLGKTALWCAATDERFSMAVANDSGCTGAALGRGKRGERIRDITTRFPYWFSQNYRRWCDREDQAPFDQHLLLAAIAPRALYVGSAEEDNWADPESELLSCVAASPVYELLGRRGLVTGDRPPATGELLHDGSIGYHCRQGTHFLSRFDWRAALAFAERRQHSG